MAEQSLNNYYIRCDLSQVGSKLVVLGPVASALTDFQMIRHQVLPSNRNNLRPNQPNQPIPPPNQPNQNNLRSPQQQNPRNLFGEPSNRRPEDVGNRARINARQNANADEQPNQPNMNYDDVQNRLQRNLHLRSRRHEVNDMFNMPKRFNESSVPSHDRIAMAAFNDTNADSPSTSATSPRERRLQSLRRMEEKIQAIRQVNAPPDPVDDQPAPQKRIKRNCIGLFVCDISNIMLDENPFIEWVEHKNFGHIANAPERLILSSLVAGNGELIMFGGLRKESLSKSSDTTMQVSNAMHFLQVPKEII